LDVVQSTLKSKIASASATVLAPFSTIYAWCRIELNNAYAADGYARTHDAGAIYMASARLSAVNGITGACR
jgi:hypothetical protein